jgi:regulatory protein
MMRRSKPDPADEPACRRTAVELLARREHSRLELTRKLAARGFEAAVVVSALDRLESTGVLAAERFTDSFVRARVAKGQGPVRIRAELAQRGIDASAAEDLLRNPDLDWIELARSVRAKRFGPEPPRDYAERARQARFLEYRGFDGATVRAALELDVDSD